ncbi:hypothetical protein SKAU_G00218530 [Synaphobranchus kaupii]|uniref:Uncharacterized protein n=1 Tax=Synaphobranchus kaupii TaxID=118154 RepID=A0A9Q1IVM9_SYNKA|nr:hypothetical protein SKAU_G00218530 [Synaphobranchus kaupii]
MRGNTGVDRGLLILQGRCYMGLHFLVVSCCAKQEGEPVTPESQPPCSHPAETRRPGQWPCQHCHSLCS